MESEGKYCAGDITRIITKVSHKARLKDLTRFMPKI
jgi:hypothetical protein